jgi:hypothetical protein
MIELSPAYLAALATQIGSLSAFLGGFAATYLATFLTFGEKGRAASGAIASAAVAAVGFVIAVVGSTMLVAATHPDAPAHEASLIGSARVTMVLSFLVAMIALMVSLGISGWVRSRGMGWLTSGLAAIGIIATTLMMAH